MMETVPKKLRREIFAKLVKFVPIPSWDDANYRKNYRFCEEMRRGIEIERESGVGWGRVLHTDVKKGFLEELENPNALVTPPFYSCVIYAPDSATIPFRKSPRWTTFVVKLPKCPPVLLVAVGWTRQ